MLRLITAVFVFFAALQLAATPVTAQIVADPTSWTYKVQKQNDSTFDLIFKLNLKENWHIWSLNPGGDGLQLPPTFSFEKNPNIRLVGAIVEAGNNKVTGAMDGVDGTVSYFTNDVVYTQKIIARGNTIVKGSHRYQVCDETQCLAPKTKSFSFTLAGLPVNGIVAANQAINTPGDSIALVAAAPSPTARDTANSSVATAGTPMLKPEQRSLLWLFLAALGGGLLAVLTPCVYSMIPITVSFFTKRSKTRAEGIRNAAYYSLSIILIFTLLGILISIFFGANALNNLSTNWIANLFFFAVFVVFGVSFLGAFEIQLPSSWTSKTDARAGVKSFGGIFFMALTLVIVSFSCTGPIVGPLLVLAGQGGIAGPVIGMLGFSIGLALPFALFAVFPGLLNKMATSGGWLNQVKVVLGFVELMLALKFLSNADLAMEWRLLDREIFIAIWIVLAIMLGMYLLGKLKLSHDDANPQNMYGQEYVSILRLFLAIVSFTFAIYLLPGMWGAPLNGMSQFLPPLGTQDFVLGKGGGAQPDAANTHRYDADIAPKKYVSQLRKYESSIAVQYGLETFFDYQEGLAAGRALKKPVMLDFTGINCVNCRKMESQVWSNPEVMRRLKEDFVVISLFCDYDNQSLPPSEQFFSKELNAQIVTVGDYNEHLQASKFQSNTQPFYFFVDEAGNKLVDDGYSYNPDVAAFVRHLETVKKNYASGRHE